MIDLRLKAPRVPTRELLLAAFPHLANRYVVSKIGLKIDKRTPLNEMLLSLKDRVIDV